MNSVIDLLVVGGGINGAGIARDASGRGLSVLLVEQDDLASHTSSASTKLIHGGLRYLEYYEFRLVREALMERERLLQIAPHIIWPLEFVLPHDAGMRPAWMIRAGLFLYDHLARRNRLPASKAVRLATHDAGAALNPGFSKGFTYADCWVDDSRLVVLNARDAAARGARIRTRTKLVSARRQGDVWVAELEDRFTGRRESVAARAMVNAAGPWVETVLKDGLGKSSTQSVRLIKGSHVVVPRLYAGEHAYILQNADKRIVFAIPYESAFTLIGTTDIAFDGEPGHVAASEDEVVYLCESVNRYFRTQLSAQDVVHCYSGVRPLYDDHSANASAVTRDYVLHTEGGDGVPPLLSVFGGKITTFRRLAEHALEKLMPLLGRSVGSSWTATSPLPGGDMGGLTPWEYASELKLRHPHLPGDLLERFARSYGSVAEVVLDGARSVEDLGADFGGGVTEREVEYLVHQEWACDATDVLWRRSKRGLHCSENTIVRIDEFVSGIGQGRKSEIA
jgi:glycerol-3-phosphate dehydrogenase